MGAKSTVDILVSTTGNTSGVDKVNAALGITEKSEKQLAAARAQFLSATEREVAEVNRLTEASQRAAAARAGEARAMVEASKLTVQETKLNTDAMKRLEEAAQRTQRFFTPQTINPWATASAGARVNVTNLHEAQEKAAGSSRNMGNAMLQASRGLQDMQYGIAGAVNNLEGIASAMGLGAGVAGVVTVLAVAVQTLGPHVLDWLKSLDTEAAKLTELKASLERAGGAIKGDYSSNVANASRISEAFTQHLKQERDALEANDRALESNLKLLKQRADLQKTENQRRLESDIADIKAQKLSQDQEQAAIATRKRQELDANKKLADDAASADISAEADKLTSKAQNRDQLKATKAALEKELAAALEYQALLKEQQRLEDAKRKAESEAMRIEADVGYLPDAFKEVRDAANKRLEDNKARQQEILNNAPGQRVRGAPEINKQIEEVTPQAQAAAEQTAKDAQALNEKLNAERQAREFRDKEYQRNLDRIAREQNGGVYDQGNLNAPPQGLPGAPMPLPAPAAPGSTLPAPMLGPAELNPQRVPTNAPAAPFGPGGDKIVSSNDQVNQTMLEVAQAMVKSNAELIKGLNTVKEQIRSQGVMS